jgi:hypothetical protein
MSLGSNSGYHHAGRKGAVIVESDPSKSGQKKRNKEGR